jgi:glycerophosphoryl diester phosphodiesterase
MTLKRIVGLAATLAVLPSMAALADGDRGGTPRLVGRAVLPAQAVAPGPQSGAFFIPGAGVRNGIEFPRPGQALAGFSAIVEGRHRGEYLAMPDNGFGGKANSTDFLIRAYYIEPDFKTRHGGSGRVRVDRRNFIQFSDPWHRIGFPIVRQATDRMLTGGDIDPESLQRGDVGDLWVGDEFGPWILHFDSRGRLLDAPFRVFDGATELKSPNHPFLAGGAPTHPNSRGFEAMAISPDGRYLYGILEGATNADLATDPASTRRHVFEFDVRRERFTGRRWTYRVEPGTPFVADAWALDRHRLVVIERDGAAAADRDVYVVDLRRVSASGALTKTHVLDLAAIPDPHLISLPPRHPGDVGLGNPYRVTCESVEAIHPINRRRLLIGCDNNLPNTGRNPNRADDSEFIVVKVPDLDHD